MGSKVNHIQFLASRSLDWAGSPEKQNQERERDWESVLQGSSVLAVVGLGFLQHGGLGVVDLISKRLAFLRTQEQKLPGCLHTKTWNGHNVTSAVLLNIRSHTGTGGPYPIPIGNVVEYPDNK